MQTDYGLSVSHAHLTDKHHNKVMLFSDFEDIRRRASQAITGLRRDGTQYS